MILIVIFILIQILILILILSQVWFGFILIQILIVILFDCDSDSAVDLFWFRFSFWFGILILIIIVKLILIPFLSKVSSFNVELSPKKPLFRVGDRQELMCQMSQCSGEMTFSWSNLEDKPLYGEIQTSLPKSTLIFKSANKNIENKIQCTANCQGKRKQAAATVRVYCEFIY